MVLCICAEMRTARECMVRGAQCASKPNGSVLASEKDMAEAGHLGGAQRCIGPKKKTRFIKKGRKFYFQTNLPNERTK